MYNWHFFTYLAFQNQESKKMHPLSSCPCSLYIWYSSVSICSRSGGSYHLLIKQSRNQDVGEEGGIILPVRRHCSRSGRSWGASIYFLAYWLDWLPDGHQVPCCPHLTSFYGLSQLLRRFRPTGNGGRRASIFALLLASMSFSPSSRFMSSSSYPHCWQ